MKIYYITRTWPENDKSMTCSNLRVAFAESLKKLGEVVVITPNYNEKTIIDENSIKIGYTFNRVKQYLQYVNVKEDYLDDWVQSSLRVLKKKVNERDVIYAVSGGELGCIKLGSLLKKECGCKFIIDYNDPVDGDILFGEKIVAYRGMNRVRLIHKYRSNADAIFTTSETYCNILKSQVSCPVFNRYIGYMETDNSFMLSHSGKDEHRYPLNIVYAGTDTAIQNSDILYRACKDIDGIKITYISSNYEEKKRTMPEKNVSCIPLMKRNDYLDYMFRYADIGFVSLKGKYSKVFVPSKIYEYINLGLPILASLPRGGAAWDIIINGGYGVVCDESNIEELREAVKMLLSSNKIEEYKKNIIFDREKWSYKEREKEYLRNILSVLGD